MKQQSFFNQVYTLYTRAEYCCSKFLAKVHCTYLISWKLILKILEFLLVLLTCSHCSRTGMLPKKQCKIYTHYVSLIQCFPIIELHFTPFNYRPFLYSCEQRHQLKSLGWQNTIMTCRKLPIKPRPGFISSKQAIEFTNIINYADSTPLCNHTSKIMFLLFVFVFTKFSNWIRNRSQGTHLILLNFIRLGPETCSEWYNLLFQCPDFLFKVHIKQNKHTMLSYVKVLIWFIIFLSYMHQKINWYSHNYFFIVIPKACLLCY